MHYLKSYDELLKNALGNMPVKTATGQRFEPPYAKVAQQGSKVIIQNFDQISQKLRRDPKDLARYFGKEMAVPSSLEGPRLILHGKISERQINERLTSYIKNFVLCNECKAPDTNITEIDGVKVLVCEACGARSPIKVK